MLRNYFTVAFRNVWKHKLFTMINIIGLGVGMGMSFIILQYVVSELSFDRFHKNGSRIFRIAEYNPAEPDMAIHPVFRGELPDYLMETNPAIKQYVRIATPGNVTISNPGDPGSLHIEPNFAFVDTSFLSVFSFDLVQGSAADLLSKPFTIVITKATAEKYFGDQNPLGKHLTYKGFKQLMAEENGQILEVAGVMENPPANSTYKFDIISSTLTHETLERDIRIFSYETLLVLDAEASAKNVERKLAAACKFVKIRNFDEKHTYGLEPLFSLHAERFSANGTKVRVFSGIAFTILLLALFNYINFTTARATTRAREVGVRKTMGVSRLSLMGQFFAESLLITVSAFLLASVLLVSVRQYLNAMFGFQLDASLITNGYFIIAIVVILAGTALIAGVYPAFVLSGFAPVKVLKGNFANGSGGFYLRRLFIIFQFAVSIVLIVGSIVAQQQVSFMKNANPGYNKEQLLNIKLGRKMAGMAGDGFKQDLRNLHGFENISVSGTSLSKGSNLMPLYNTANKKQEYIGCVVVDEDFIGNVGLNFLVPFNANMPADSSGFYYILNEAAVKEMGLTNETAIGQQLFESENQPMAKVAGVVKNFSMFGPKHKDRACVLKLHNGRNHYHRDMGSMQVRLNAGDNIRQKIALLEKVYKEYEPNWPFQYSFADEDFEKTFQDDLHISKMMRVFTIVAVFLACMGLFGLITFATQTRTKEIGIRKVMGASLLDLAGLLSLYFVKLVLVSIVVGIPISFYLTEKWLQNFATRIEVNGWIYALTALSTIFVALITVSFQSINAARKNPVRTLRIE